jgi:type IV pilus assembly protein PilA
MKTALAAARARRAQGDGGFTLIELMVVIMIVGILLAIGVPTFFGARTRAYDSEAKSNLRSGMMAAQTMYADSRTFYVGNSQAGARSAVLATEPNLKLTVNANQAPASGEVSFYADNQVWSLTTNNWAGTGSGLRLSAKSQSGRCYGIWMNSTGEIKYYTMTAAVASGCQSQWAHPYYDVTRTDVTEGW